MQQRNAGNGEDQHQAQLLLALKGDDQHCATAVCGEGLIREISPTKPSPSLVWSNFVIADTAMSQFPRMKVADTN